MRARGRVLAWRVGKTRVKGQSDCCRADIASRLLFVQ